eukprot:scaffold5481_cov117-Isochrysis_galbana.AAC.2
MDTSMPGDAAPLAPRVSATGWTCGDGSGSGSSSGMHAASKHSMYELFGTDSEAPDSEWAPRRAVWDEVLRNGGADSDGAGGFGIEPPNRRPEALREQLVRDLASSDDEEADFNWNKHAGGATLL